jgi:hypothetical protein
MLVRSVPVRCVICVICVICSPCPASEAVYSWIYSSGELLAVLVNVCKSTSKAEIPDGSGGIQQQQRDKSFVLATTTSVQIASYKSERTKLAALRLPTKQSAQSLRRATLGASSRSDGL